MPKHISDLEVGDQVYRRSRYAADGGMVAIITKVSKDYYTALEVIPPGSTAHARIRPLTISKNSGKVYGEDKYFYPLETTAEEFYREIQKAKEEREAKNREKEDAFNQKLAAVRGANPNLMGTKEIIFADLYKFTFESPRGEGILLVSEVGNEDRLFTTDKTQMKARIAGYTLQGYDDRQYYSMWTAGTEFGETLEDILIKAVAIHCWSY